MDVMVQLSTLCEVFWGLLVALSAEVVEVWELSSVMCGCVDVTYYRTSMGALVMSGPESIVRRWVGCGCGPSVSSHW